MRRSVKLYCMDRTERKSCNIFIIFKQETACEMRISDWSSDVCSSDLRGPGAGNAVSHRRRRRRTRHPATFFEMARPAGLEPATTRLEGGCSIQLSYGRAARLCGWATSEVCSARQTT